MSIEAYLIVSLVAGLHAATYGAYKDAPYESYMPSKTAREFGLCLAIAVVLWYSGVAEGETLLILCLSIHAISRFLTEFWKLFVRVQPQENYRIPTQIHLFSHVVQNRPLRLLMGFGLLGAIVGIGALCTLIPDGVPVSLRGLMVGLAIGTGDAVAGAYKDGSIEGFYWHKFAKSPVFIGLGGLVVSGHTESTAFLLLASFGLGRMFLELLFKLVVPEYGPGKFLTRKGTVTEWIERRHVFLPPYVATWAVIAVLATHPLGW